MYIPLIEGKGIKKTKLKDKRKTASMYKMATLMCSKEKAYHFQGCKLFWCRL